MSGLTEEQEQALARLGLTYAEAEALAARLAAAMQPYYEAAKQAVAGFAAWAQTPEVQAWLAGLPREQEKAS